MLLSDANAERLQCVLSVLAPAKGAAAEVRTDGYLWMRNPPGTRWHCAVRILGHELHAAQAGETAYMQQPRPSH